MLDALFGEPAKVLFRRFRPLLGPPTLPPEPPGGYHYERRVALGQEAEAAAWRQCRRLALFLCVFVVPFCFLLRALTPLTTVVIATVLLSIVAFHLVGALVAVLCDKPGEWVLGWLGRAAFWTLAALPVGLLRVGLVPGGQAVLLIFAVAVTVIAKGIVAKAYAWWLTARPLEREARFGLRDLWSAHDLAPAAALALALVGHKVLALKALPGFFIAFLAVHFLCRGLRGLGSLRVCGHALVVFLGYEDPRGGVCVFRLPNECFRTRRRKALLLAAPVLAWALLLVSTAPFPAFDGLLSLVRMAVYLALPAGVAFLLFWLTEGSGLAELGQAAEAADPTVERGDPPKAEKTAFQLRTEQMLSSPHEVERTHFCPGRDYLTGVPVPLPEQQLCEHVMVIGPPAAGKTSMGFTAPLLWAIEANGRRRQTQEEE